MKNNYKDLGKVCLTIEGIWDNTKKYDNITIVEDSNYGSAYISKQVVPVGIDITNTDYWQCLGKKAVVDNSFNVSSTNAISNKVVTELRNRLDSELSDINAELFPLSASVSGDKIYRKGTTDTFIYNWTVKAGSKEVTPDKITINGLNIPVTGSSGTQSFTVSTSTNFVLKIYKGDDILTYTRKAIFTNPNLYGKVAADFVVNATNVGNLKGNRIPYSRAYSNEFSDLNNNKICYAYPKQFGALTSIKDANGFEYINSYNRTELAILGETYYVYLLDNPTTISKLTQIWS